MKYQARAVVAVIAGLCLGLDSAARTATQPTSQDSSHAETVAMKHASGAFDVKLVPQPPDEGAKDSGVGRMSIDKQFHGDLEGTSQGQMLAVRTEVKDSAGYVALERVTGTLGGRSGSFALQHSGTMTRGAPELVITVVPDSGTGQLVGLSGKMTIQIEGGNHSYDFEYALPASR